MYGWQGHAGDTGWRWMHRDRQDGKNAVEAQDYVHDHGDLVQQCRLVWMGPTGSLLPQRVMLANRP